MPIVIVYLFFLFIAPQLWINPIIGWRPDIFIYSAWVLFASRRWDRVVTITSQDTFFLLMIAWFAISTVTNGLRANSSQILFNYVKFFLLYKLVAATVETVERVRIVAIILVLFALVLSIEGIQHMHSTTGLGWAGQSFGWIDPDAAKLGIAGRTRWINIFDGPGVFCVVYTIALPFVLQYMGKPFQASIKVIGIALIVPVLLAIYYTGSRGGFLTTLGLIGIYTSTRLRVAPIKILVASSICVVLFMLAPSYITTMNDQSHSASHRVDMWAEGLEMLQQNPLLGIGKGNFIGYTNRLIAHNSSIEIMGETGMVGLFLWVGLLYLSLKNIVLYIREEKDEINKAYATSLGLSVTGYIISSMFVSLEYETLYFLLGLCAVIGSQVKEKVKFLKKDLLIVGSVCVGLVVLIKIFVMLYK